MSEEFIASQSILFRIRPESRRY